MLKLSRAEWRGLRWGLFFISPWIFHFIAFNVYPVLASFYYSFTNFEITNLSPRWVGLQNYTSMLILDDRFWVAMQNTLTYVLLLVILATALDVVVAFLLSLEVFGLSVHRSIFFMPVLVPEIARALTWIWILNPRFGLVNGLLAQLGIRGPYWTSSPDTALISIVMIGVWGSGGAILIYLAGLRDIPRHLYEAAQVDGANIFHRMRHITLPLLTPQILFNVTMAIIHGMQQFTMPYLVTGGGPQDATLVYGLQMYRRAFVYFDYGYASGMGWILFVVILVLTLLLFRISQSRVHYER